jgi:hypothetical protein
MRLLSAGRDIPATDLKMTLKLYRVSESWLGSEKLMTEAPVTSPLHGNRQAHYFHADLILAKHNLRVF